MANLNLVSGLAIGRKLDDAGIKLLRETLEKAERGEVLNVALVAEKSNGDMVIAFSPGVGDRMKQCGASGILHRRIQDSIIGGK